MLKAIHAAEDVTEAREKALRAGAKLREQRMTKAAELVEGGIEETLAYYAFPEEHWRRIRTNNPLERILREIRRRTRVVGAFPDGQSALNLAAARLRHIAGSEWSTKRYLSMDLLKDHQIRSTPPSSWRRALPRRWPTTSSPRRTGDASEPITRSSASCARFAGDRAWSAPFLTDNRR
jgi:Transposase, Mutator family